jgi:hypothetical protein
VNAFQQQVLEALGHFTGFMTARIITQWFVQAPDPQAEIDMCVETWKQESRDRFNEMTQAHFARTGLISNEGDHFEAVLAEAEKRLRASLEGAVRIHLQQREQQQQSGEVIQ